jgi:hypothetical protein
LGRSDGGGNETNEYQKDLLILVQHQDTSLPKNTAPGQQRRPLVGNRANATLTHMHLLLACRSAIVRMAHSSSHDIVPSTTTTDFCRVTVADQYPRRLQRRPSLSPAKREKGTAMTTEQKIIRGKVGLLEKSLELGERQIDNESISCPPPQNCSARGDNFHFT